MKRETGAAYQRGIVIIIETEHCWGEGCGRDCSTSRLPQEIFFTLPLIGQLYHYSACSNSASVYEEVCGVPVAALLMIGPAHNSVGSPMESGQWEFEFVHPDPMLMSCICIRFFFFLMLCNISIVTVWNSTGPSVERRRRRRGEGVYKVLGCEREGRCV